MIRPDVRVWRGDGDTAKCVPASPSEVLDFGCPLCGSDVVVQEDAPTIDAWARYRVVCGSGCGAFRVTANVDVAIA